MRYLEHTPPSPLGRYVDKLWYCEAPELPQLLERVFPSGRMSLIINLAEDELRWYDGPDRGRCVRLGGAAVCGARVDYVTIDTAEQRAVIGVEFLAGGGVPFFGLPADELEGQHVPLDALWGRQAPLARERILEAPTPEARVRVLASLLRARLASGLERDPAIEFALSAFADPAAGYTIGDVVGRLGMTPKRFIRAFSEQVGLTPKLYCRVKRFQQVTGVLAEVDEVVSWADLALTCGYYDQAHFIHDFRAFAGLTPTEYLARRSARNHVRIDGM
jgi:AraC-like DNA-binding protein